jgi:hypothetical protein
MAQHSSPLFSFNQETAFEIERSCTAELVRAWWRPAITMVTGEYYYSCLVLAMRCTGTP